MNNAAALAGQVTTEDEALEVFHALRSRFGWAGTVFTRADVESHVETALSDHDERHAALVTDALVDAVVDSHEYRHLADRMTEVGNETLADAVALSPLLAEGGECTHVVVLGGDDGDGIRTETVEVGPFATFAEAADAGLAGLGLLAEQVLAEFPGQAEEMTADPVLLGGPLRGFTLVVVEHGQTVAQYPAQP